MAKIKYDPAATPLVNEHDGYTFQPNHYGQSMFPSTKGSRKRYGNQWSKQHNNQKAVTRWRDMSQATKDLWALFAATFPQPSKRDPDKFLTGYQLFIKRNSYCFLNHGIHSDFMLEPEFIEIPNGEITFNLSWSEDAIDCTENYLKNWGILPQVGEYVILYAHIYNEYSGQFFFPISKVLQVNQIYLDGLFCTVTVPDEMLTTTVSVYLSKVFHQSVQYAGTKCRYMGCFTKKRFKDLIDTPSSYAGQAGKVPVVNATEDGLEFQEAGSGGITCEDLQNCPTIISMQEKINNIADVVSIDLNTSVPPVKLGILYNHSAVIDSRHICATGWHIPTRNEFETLFNAAGGITVAGAKLKQNSLNWWDSLTGNETNEFYFNARGAGYRVGIDGGYFLIKRDLWLQSYDLWSGRISGIRFSDLIDGLSLLYISDLKVGTSLRVVKDSTSLQNGESGTYKGNNGVVYRTICIGGLEITADNLMETKFRNGELIPEVSDAVDWSNLTTAALCYYDNDPDNA